MECVAGRSSCRRDRRACTSRRSARSSRTKRSPRCIAPTTSARTTRTANAPPASGAPALWRRRAIRATPLMHRAHSFFCYCCANPQTRSRRVCEEACSATTAAGAGAAGRCAGCCRRGGRCRRARATRPASSASGRRAKRLRRGARRRRKHRRRDARGHRRRAAHDVVPAGHAGLAARLRGRHTVQRGWGGLRRRGVRAARRPGRRWAASKRLHGIAQGGGVAGSSAPAVLTTVRRVVGLCVATRHCVEPFVPCLTRRPPVCVERHARSWRKFKRCGQARCQGANRGATRATAMPDAGLQVRSLLTLTVRRGHAPR